MWPGDSWLHQCKDEKSQPQLQPQKQHCLKQQHCHSIKVHTIASAHQRILSTTEARNRRRRTKSATSTVAAAAGIKWKIIISTIIFLLCRLSHVLAIRKGRLMSPSSFTALSGDLHVQIQFSSEDAVAPVGDMDELPPSVLGADASTISSTTIRNVASTTSRMARPTQRDGQRQIHGIGVEQTVMSTLVISKYIDEYTSSIEETATSVTHFNDSATNATRPPEITVSPSEDATQRPTVLQRRRKEIVQNIPVYPDPRHNVTQVAVPCQTFLRGGLYEMQVITNLKTTAPVPVPPSNSTSSKRKTTAQEPPPTMTTTTLMPVVDERLRQTLDVRWPSADMQVTPTRLLTYPNHSVEVVLRFPEVNCERAWHEHNALELPEFWLELIYCGKERTCAQLLPQNISKSHILYAEQVRGYPKQKRVQLGCELFGLAGNYAVQLRPMVPAPNVPITRRFLSVDWSDKFVFNVYARSIFPCDPHTGIGVLYEYPACILEQGDRVRVYAKLRADVASLKPPTTLHYVAEQRVVKSQHSLYFSCELFTEKYVEYCFVYVSQAISGAVADVRMDCVPTLPVSDSDTGGWGPWSEWTPCSTNCLGGTRNRYRFCDSPPPRYGAKFCEGPSVQTEKCGKTISDTWDCIYESSGTSFTKANRTEVNQEIGPGCRCGCIVHLGSSKPKRILAGATQSCPGRSFWLIQVDGEENIALRLNFLRLPCAAQYIKVRDGPSLSSTLLIELNGGNNLNMPKQIESTGAQLLLEFHAAAGSYANGQQHPSNSSISSNINAACTGGFLANVEQIAARNGTSTLLAAAAISTTRLSSVKSRAVLQQTKLRSQFTLVHLSAVVFASIIILISALLGAQYVVRYRKYHLAVARRRDEGSRLHTPHASMSSLQGPPSRAMSTTTLLSEVIYLVKMRPKHQLRHSILRESVDAENLARETEFKEDDAELQSCIAKCVAARGSNDSIVTLRNEVFSPGGSGSLSRTPSLDDAELSPSTAADVARLDDSKCSGTLTRKDSAKDTESIISSGMSELCASPPTTQSKRFSRYSARYEASTLKLHDATLSDRDSLRSSLLSQLGGTSRSASASLTNGCYSPAAASVVSTATIRTTNPKESKEQQNRKRLLARPGSEFSLGQQEELEFDYYDYNVINAGAAPGSYLGMDPAHLIWIPPLEDITDSNGRDDDDKTPEPQSPIHEPDETAPLYEEIKMPKYGHYLSARSNTTSTSTSGANTTSNTTPSSDELSPLGSHLHSKATSPTCATDMNLRNCLLQQVTRVKHPTPFLTRKQRRQAKLQSKSASMLDGSVSELMPLNPLSGTKSARNIRRVPERMIMESTTTTPRSSPDVNAANEDDDDAMTSSYVEKETLVEKRTSPESCDLGLVLDDIQYADESESEHDLAKQRGKASEKEQHKLTEEMWEDKRATVKRVSVDSAIVEKRGITRELSSYRVETNV